ncbi:hypothetical protein SCUCBS95973_005740 [Sporothrix curviconia]|uniref:Uncharacterized protein n=1 Tax=Sporothrix curviconia TaxID=1260050 RepID=A0ABP0BZD0_9PEZI
MTSSALGIAVQLQEKTTESDSQTLPAYLAQISRLHAHGARLLPRILPGALPAHIQPSVESSTGTRSTSSQATTSGRTDITSKYYPLQLRPWHAFREEVQRPGFVKVAAALRESRGLPSRSWIQNDEKTLLERLNLLALNQKGGLIATRTDRFLETVLLMPASRILNEYLSHGRRVTKQVCFDTDVESVATVHESLSPRSGSNRSDSSETSTKMRSVFPDCLVLYMDPAPTAEDPVQLIASAEHKPVHALRAASVAKMVAGNIAEDLVVRVARQSLTRLEKKRAKERAEQQGRASASTSVPGVEVTVEQAHADRASGVTSKTARVDRLTYFAYSLTQAFHYMLMAGLEFGYLATGEVLVFLRIPEDDATTLYYHVSLFPIPSNATSDNNTSNSGGDSTEVPGLLTQMPYPAPGDAVDEEALAELPIAHMVSFCEYALEAKRRSPSWVVEQMAKLALFPDLPPGIAARYTQSPASQLGRRRHDDGDGDGGGGGGGDSDGRSRLGRLQAPYRNNRVQTASPLQQHKAAENSGPTDCGLDITTSFLSTACDLQTRPRPSHKVQPPTLPYCTHACLLGLVQNGPLDLQCPNITLHQAASRRNEDGSSSQEQQHQDHARHSLTALELSRRIRDQLYDTPEVDCELLAAHRGAVGYPFKLTLTGFGYTFVGKAVQHAHRRRLIQEARIYETLQPLQGSVIPVLLGLIRLHVGYPVLSEFVQLPNMMLLSYAGASMLGALLYDDDDETAPSPETTRYRAEAARTQAELARWGFNDDDDNASNFRWCAETGRAMRIDFDRAYLVPSARLLRVSTNVPVATHEQNTLRASSQAGSPSSAPTATASSCTPQTPVDKAALAALGDGTGGPLAKRQKTDEAGGSAAVIETDVR